MKLLLRAAIATIAATAASIPLQDVVADEQTGAVRKWVETNVPAMMQEAMTPGLAIAVVRDGDTMYADGFGARDPARGLPVTPDTLFGIGSITKSFVAISILQLADQGKVELDDPVSKHIPFELGREGVPITIRHFLTHSPGFPSLATSSILLGRGLGEDTGVPMASADDFFRFVNGAHDEIVFDPGEHYFYNNAAWRMLGAIVQDVSRMPFHEYVTTNVIRPLGMQRTTFDTDALFADPDHLTPHRIRGDVREPTGFPYTNPADNPGFSFLSAAGGISSSVNEMTRYVNMLIDLGEHDGERLVSRRSMQEMQSLHIREPNHDYGTAGYGFGLGVVPDFLGEKLIEHGGSIAVSTARISLIPARRIGVVTMANSGGIDHARITESVLAILLGEDPGEVIPRTAIRERMRRFEGSYATYRGIETIGIVEDDGLLHTVSGNELTPLIPEDPSYRGTSFYQLDGGRRTPVEFRFGDDGSVMMLRARYVFHKLGVGPE